jgi:membrane fusion protein (multidrug efflux system)
MNATETVAIGASPQPTGRRHWLILLTLVLVIAAIAYLVYYLLIARFHESTDDAYVNGNIVQVTPQVVGTVIAVNADNTQTIKQGEPLVKLDPADSRIALQQAEANLAQTVRQVHTLFVNNRQYEAIVAQRKSDLQRAREDLRRRTDIAQTGAVSHEDLTHARDILASAQANFDAAYQQLASNQALTTDVSVTNHPGVLVAAAHVRDAYLSYARNTLPAPVTGYVAQRIVQVGQRVAPGTPLMAVVPLDGVWVDANFKEIQLTHMRIGQSVTLVADVYGSSLRYHGKIVGFSAGTGSAFALLPAQNATGNWIKVVQRLPVRIALDSKELQDHPLRVGLSMSADVLVKDEHGTSLGEAPNTVYQTNVFDKYGQEADAEIARIIAQNAGSTTVTRNAVTQLVQGDSLVKH